MSSEELHAPREKLTPLTYATHEAIVSLMEELQAIDWYGQRADDCDDEELKAVLVHNMNDEMEHAAMLIEWLRRNVPEFATQLTKFLGVKGAIA
jgi:hypothetical protein